jgi:hypothetical protein
MYDLIFRHTLIFRPDEIGKRRLANHDEAA